MTEAYEDSPHQEMMLNLFLAVSARQENSDDFENEPYWKKAIELLKSGTVNPHDQDYQLFRELKVRRFHQDQAKLITEAIRNFGCTCEKCMYEPDYE
jgi:hypothetical protein